MEYIKKADCEDITIMYFHLSPVDRRDSILKNGLKIGQRTNLDSEDIETTKVTLSDKLYFLKYDPEFNYKSIINQIYDNASKLTEYDLWLIIDEYEYITDHKLDNEYVSTVNIPIENMYYITNDEDAIHNLFTTMWEQLPNRFLKLLCTINKETIDEYKRDAEYRGVGAGGAGGAGGDNMDDLNKYYVKYLKIRKY